MSKSYNDCLSTTIRHCNSTTEEDILADAAPDLLKACEAALKYLLAHRPKGNIRDTFHELNEYENDVVKPLRAAIAKATQ